MDDFLNTNNNAGTLVKWLTLRNLIIEGFDQPTFATEWDDYGTPSNADWEGAINMEYAEGITIDGCTIRRGGSRGIYIDTCRNITVDGCTIHDVGYDGIAVRGLASIAEKGDGPIFIDNNTIYDSGERYWNSSGIICDYNGECYLRDNLIYNMPKSGIRIGRALSGLHNYAGKTIISGNRLRNCMETMADSAAIYVNGWTADESRIDHNHIKDIIRTAAHDDIRTDDRPANSIRGIYLDQGSANWKVDRNLVYRTGNASLFMHIGGPGNVIENNIFVDAQSGSTHSNPAASIAIKWKGTRESGDGSYDVYAGGDTVRWNIFYNRLGLPTIRYLLYNSSYYAAVGGVMGHHYENIAFPNDLIWAYESPGTYSHEDLAYALTTWSLQQGSVGSDPLFIDYAQDDFTIAPSSPALVVGFKPFTVTAF